MTSNNCRTACERVAEAAEFKGYIEHDDIVINVQGDEPLIDPKDILTVLDAARKHKGTIINGMCPIEDEKDFHWFLVIRFVLLPVYRNTHTYLF